ncbi:MAG TPA: copper resistance protein CopC [Gemmatimonadales bacterium]|jgi:hypothetical protein|nr:copper resistance protein CopC [Gemmatimonadales bacterium]
MLKPVLALLTAATVAGGALFHAELKSSLPAANSTVTAPKAITLTFTEAVTLRLSGISIYDAKNTALVQKLVVQAKGDTVVWGPVTKPLVPGKYTVRWKNGAADDGHPESGTFVFTVTK